MKYILSTIISLLFFSCNQKKLVEREVSENEKPYFTEGQIAPKESVVVIDNSFDFDDYNDSQLDSIFRLSLDSMVDFLNVTKFDKDTIITNYFSSAMYGQAKFGFPEFVILDSKYLDAMDSVERGYRQCPSYIYVNKNNKLEFVTTIMTTEKSGEYAHIYRRDMNFDNQVDLIIKRGLYMASREAYHFYIFTKQNLNESAFIGSTDTLVINTTNKTVISFTHGGAYGIYAKTINKWQGDTLAEIRRLEQTYGIKMEIDLMEEFVTKNGKETKIKSRKMNSDKAHQYFNNYK